MDEDMRDTTGANDVKEVGNDRKIKIKSENVLLGIGVVNICPLVVACLIYFLVGRNGFNDVLRGLFGILLLYQFVGTWIVLFVVILLGMANVIMGVRREAKNRKKIYMALILYVLPVVVNICFIYFYLGRL